MLTKELSISECVQPMFIEPMQVVPVRELPDSGKWTYEPPKVTPGKKVTDSLLRAVNDPASNTHVAKGNRGILKIVNLA